MKNFRPLRTLLYVWVALAVALSVRTWVHPDKHTCFPVYAASAQHWWADEPIYADYHPALDYFRYLPIFAVLITPFAYLGLTVGGIVWANFNLAVFAAGLWRFQRVVLPRNWSEQRQALFLALATLGALRSLWNSQCNVFAVGVLLLGVASAVQRKWWPAAGMLGASVLAKLTPVPIVLLFVALWPRQLLARVALVLALGGFLPFLTRPADIVTWQYQGLAEQMRETSTTRWPGFRDAWTVWLVTCDLFDQSGKPMSLVEPLDSGAYRLVQLVTAGAVLAWCLRYRLSVNQPAELALATLGMGAVWLLLFGPAPEHPTYVFLAPSLAAAAVEPGFRRGRNLILASAVLILGLGWGFSAAMRPRHGSAWTKPASKD
jgi:hypothetical protein